ncbi:expressed unknown protein [Seminavis robusta]|uniref:Uncharacterized protein n=1 Tax=Seminavis robusta TaxID=568900 RepID=A0A9N8DTY3_9STRA|nr:expressed unknown protein [Seminavis robusta]|eukprot:Sro276_g106020.1 n/a (335) ;mRNA; r:45313-46317
MTNPTPDFSAQIKFGSIGDTAQSFGKLTVVPTASETVLSDALLSPEMDPKASSNNDDNTKKVVHKKPKISFLVDAKDEIVEQVHEYYFPANCEEECWWTDDELDQLLTEAMLVAEHFTTKRKDWQNKIKTVLKGCAGGKSKDGKPVKIKASDLDFVVDSEARGLELYIHPIFQKNRVKAVKGVVKVQAEYNACEKKKGKKDPELRLKVLRAQSLKLTQTARTMAKTMADGDRRVAQDGEDRNEANNGLLAGIPPGEEVVPSEELRTPSAELKPEEFETPPPRPKRGLSPMRRSDRPTGLAALRDQNNRRMLGKGSGGITALQGELQDLSDHSSS